MTISLRFGAFIYKTSFICCLLADIQKNDREENRKSYAAAALLISVWFFCQSCTYSRDRALLEAFVFVCSLYIFQGLNISRQDCTECALCCCGVPLLEWINKVISVVFMEEKQCGRVPGGLLLITLVCDGGEQSDCVLWTVPC